jgi:hypothetical protein
MMRDAPTERIIAGTPGKNTLSSSVKEERENTVLVKQRDGWE